MSVPDAIGDVNMPILYQLTEVPFKPVMHRRILFKVGVPWFTGLISGVSVSDKRKQHLISKIKTLLLKKNNKTVKINKSSQ